MDDALVQLSGQLASMVWPALLPFVAACGTGCLLLRLLDDLHRQPAGPARVPLLLTALAAAIGLWTTSLQPLVPYWPSHAALSSAHGMALTFAAFGWNLAVTALWCMLGGRPGVGIVRTLLMGLLLGACGPLTQLIQAGAQTVEAVALQDAGVLVAVVVLSATACSVLLQVALLPAGEVGRRPAMSLFVCLLLGIGLTLGAVFGGPVLGTQPAAAVTEAPGGIRLVLMAGPVVAVLAVLLLGFRDRAAGDRSAAVISREIRRRKETMQALNDLEQSYRQREAELSARHQLLLDGAHVGLWEFDLITRGAHFSERFATMLGYTLKEIGPSTSEYLRLVHPDDLPLVLNRIQVHVDGDAPSYAAEFRMRHKDGGYRRIQASGTALRDAGGRATLMAGSHTDVKQQASSGAAQQQPYNAPAQAEPDVSFRRQGLWESWSPLDNTPVAAKAEPGMPAQAPIPAPAPASTSAAATDGLLPAIDPSALH
ncbi:PAS domain-containing protein [Ralstonia solanacearum]|uniref:PAS domain-containing protein n=1 Tax=Ralstonia solanacearum TaxID=305 RepID=UPI0012A20C31|nr:PAS domain-containing protein [Ralstonia solanacearum]AYB62878.1 histidine kinase [Ralstonia solanacearum]